MIQGHRLSILAPLGVGVIALVCTITIYLVPLRATVNLVRRNLCIAEDTVLSKTLM